jgi:sugar/nucleoside kinase (ribokinase family)
VTQRATGVGANASASSEGPAPTTGVRVMVAGPVYCDLVFGGLDRLPRLGEERFAPTFRVTVGGSAITAIALRRLGHVVTLASEVGDDDLGVVVRRLLAAEDVDLSGLHVRSDAATAVTAALSTTADRAFVTYLAPAAPDVDLARVLEASGAAHLHVGGFPVALAHPDLVGRAHALGVTVSFDPGWDEGALADPLVRRWAGAADVLLPNRLEAERLVDARPGPAEGDARAVLDRLAANRADLVTVVKDGAHGAWAAQGERHVFAPAPNVSVLDTTGAGDVFDAGFLDAWWRGEGLEASLRQGVHCGALATTAYGGATAAPRRADLERAA